MELRKAGTALVLLKAMRKRKKAQKVDLALRLLPGSRTFRAP